ncbi:MAG TPA: DEAD/DEAH box helicase, partial [Polyangiaceae bacterium]|nr:DEAD/DEAH box helicase [Polyangiaceae bacterium]
MGRLPPRSSQRARLTQSQGLLSDQTWAEAQALAQRLGAGTLSELQKRIIGASLEGRNVVASLAAGQGKSTCAAIVAHLCGGVAVILSPSPRLTREQQQRLEHRRVPALRLDPNAPEANQVKLCGELGSGEPAVLFTTPAALAGCPTVRDALRERGVTLCVVEEAQTLAESSHSVSPSLTAWRRLLVDLGRPTVLALLAPASFTSRRQVTECLELGAPVVIEAEPIRENVSVEVHRLSGDARKRAFSALAQELRRPGLILATTAREVEEIHALLAAARVPAHRYHADLSPSERLGEQLNFMLPGRKTVMVAQSAFAPSTGIAGIDDERLLDGAPRGFGFGLDKRDLRFLVHWGAPASAEQCAREIGAIGRDGDEARAIVYCDEGDTSRNGALLLRHRLHPPHAAALADALDGQVFETRKTNFEALALETGLSLATVESWCS